ncbi:MAG: stage III sporulation protein AF [Lachnospiraceae bacterium]
MDQVYRWVQNIVCYLIFATVITNILPGKKYDKYLKLFVGMVLILLVLQPLTGALRLEDKIAYYFESITFQNDANDLSRDFLGAEQKRLELMVDQYETAVALDLEAMVKDAGFYPVQIQAAIEGNPEAELFGMVTSISMRLSLESSGKEEAEEAEIRSEIIPVEPVQIQTDPAESGAADTKSPFESGAVNTENPFESGANDGEDPGIKSREERGKEDEAIRSLRRKIADYYDLEAEYVGIQLE